MTILFYFFANSEIGSENLHQLGELLPIAREVKKSKENYIPNRIFVAIFDLRSLFKSLQVTKVKNVVFERNLFPRITFIRNVQQQNRYRRCMCHRDEANRL